MEFAAGNDRLGRLEHDRPLSALKTRRRRLELASRDVRMEAVPLSFIILLRKLTPQNKPCAITPRRHSRLGGDVMLSIENVILIYLI